MSDQSKNPAAVLEARIRKLEWSARISWYVTLLILVAAGFAGYEAYWAHAAIVDRHGNLQLLNEKRDARVLLFKGDSASGIKLYDHLNEQRATLATSVEGSAMTLRDDITHMRIMARVSGDGPEILMADRQKNVRISIQVHDEGPRILFYNPEGEVTFDTNQLVQASDPIAIAEAPADEPAAATAVD